MLSQLTPEETLLMLSADDQGWILFPHDPFGERSETLQVLNEMEKKGYVGRTLNETCIAFHLTMLGEYLRCGIVRRRGVSKVDYHDHILRAGIALADEIERMYHYQLETFSIAAITDRGLLKARLFATTFAAAAYIMGQCAETPRDANDFSRECIGVAMRPLSRRRSDSGEPDEAAPFADPFMSKILYLIKSEFVHEPGAFEHKSEAFREIVETYHQCLIESVGHEHLPVELRRELERTVSDFVRHLFNVMDDLLDEVLQVNSTTS